MGYPRPSHQETLPAQMTQGLIENSGGSHCSSKLKTLFNIRHNGTLSKIMVAIVLTYGKGIKKENTISLNPIKTGLF